MKNIKKILLFTIIISSINIFFGITEFKYKDLFSRLYANEHNQLSDVIILNSSKTNTSIEIKRGMRFRVNKNKEKYTFVSYDIKNNIINLTNEMSRPIYYSLSHINYISVRFESFPRENLSVDNMRGALAGGLAGAAIGAYPSALAGWVVAMTLENSSSEYTAVPLLACMGVTAAGTALSAKVGSDIGKNLGNPYVHIPLMGKNAWHISVY